MTKLQYAIGTVVTAFLVVVAYITAAIIINANPNVEHIFAEIGLTGIVFGLMMLCQIPIGHCLRVMTDGTVAMVRAMNGALK